MKGLLIKDYLILARQAKTIVLLVIMGMIMSMTMQSETIISYLTIMSVMLSLGTLSYDEFDNGFPYLFTLPVSRKTYAIEKYVFTLACALITALLSTLLSLLVVFFKGENVSSLSDALPVIAIMLGLAAITISFTIPSRLKYGSEKGRTVLYIVCGLIGLAGFLGSRFLPDLPDSAAVFFTQHLQLIGIMITLIIIALFVLSLLISIRIMERKEF